MVASTKESPAKYQKLGTAAICTPELYVRLVAEGNTGSQMTIFSVAVSSVLLNPFSKGTDLIWDVQGARVSPLRIAFADCAIYTRRQQPIRLGWRNR
jgi:hypothetical protein